MLEITSKIELNREAIEAPNLTDRFTQQELDSIGQYCHYGWDADRRSREAWLRRSEAGMELAMQVQKAKTFPWPDASNVIFPLISIAALQFSARAYSGIITAPELVKYIILADQTDQEIINRADRMGRFMSFQLLEQDTAWEEQHDRLFINLSIVGTAFIKSRYDAILRHNVGELVLARDLVVNYWAKNLSTAPRITQEIELSRNEVVTLVRSGAWADILGEEWFKSPSPPTLDPQTDKNNRWGVDPNEQPDPDTPFQFLEQHRSIDLDCDGYAEPYIITVHRQTKKTVRIALNCNREEDIERNDDNEIISITKTEYYTKYSFIPAPDGGFYDLGFGVLMGPLNEGVNTAINQLFDAGTVANLGGGFLGRGAKLKGGSMGFIPGLWRQVDSTGDDLRKSMVPLPTPEPSSVLFQLLGLLIEYTNQLAGSTDMVLGKNPGQNTPAETARGMMESGLQIYSTIFKRIWRSMKEEFVKYHILNRQFLPLRTTFGDGKSIIKREDFLTNPEWVRPAADPNTVSAAQRLNQAMMVREAAYTAPGGYDIDAVERLYLDALRVPNRDAIYVGLENAPPGEDPKVQVEKMRTQIEMQDQQLRQWEFIKEWQEAIRLNTARIQNLEAQTASILQDMDIAQAQQARDALQAFIDGIKSHNDMLNERVRVTVDMLKADREKKDGEAKSGSSGKGSSSRARKSPGVSTGGSSSASASQMAGGDAGPVGIGLRGGFTD